MRHRIVPFPEMSWLSPSLRRGRTWVIIIKKPQRLSLAADSTATVGISPSDRDAFLSPLPPPRTSRTMTATAADVRSILSIPAHSATQSAAPRKPSTSQAKKPEGISRELYSLIGPSAPSLAAQLQKPRLKQKPRLGSSAVRWYALYHP